MRSVCRAGAGPGANVGSARGRHRWASKRVLSFSNSFANIILERFIVTSLPIPRKWQGQGPFAKSPRGATRWFQDRRKDGEMDTDSVCVRVCVHMCVRACACVCIVLSRFIFNAIFHSFGKDRLARRVTEHVCTSTRGAREGRPPCVGRGVASSLESSRAHEGCVCCELEDSPSLGNAASRALGLILSQLRLNSQLSDCAFFF